MASSILPPSHITQHLFPQLLTASSSALRLDNRSPSTALTPHIEYSPSKRGVVTISLSAPSSPTRKTIIQTSIHAELVEPRSDRPYEGQITLNVNPNLAFGLSSAARSSPSADAAIAELERQLDLALRRSGLVDREALCLKAGQLVWNISITLHLMSLEAGNALYASVVAASIALVDFRRPDAAVEEGGKIVVYDESERVTVPLPITGGLVAVEVAVFIPPAPAGTMTSSTAARGQDDADDDDEMASPNSARGPILLLDPTPIEVTLSSALLTYVLTPNTGQFLLSEKVGRTPLDVDVMLKAMRMAETRAKAIGKWQEQQKKRREEQVGQEMQ